MIVTCNICGKKFEKKPSKVGERNYCSHKCLGISNGVRNRKSHSMVCDHCGKVFIHCNRHGNRNKHFFCSRECGWAAKKRKELVYCEWCGCQFEKKRSDIKRTNHNLCDRGCYQDFINLFQAGSKNQIVSGKVLYRQLAEINLGRALANNEEVHHIDGDHCNNNKENLIVISKSKHMSIHAKSKRRDLNGRFIRES